jgi:Zn finger protein HypA/HybF involved in hydrogenase expression
MHEGCSGYFLNGQQMADKVRLMGFENMPTENPLDIVCINCNQTFGMQTMLACCPTCDMVYSLTPCHSNSADNVKPAGIGY